MISFDHFRAAVLLADNTALVDLTQELIYVAPPALTREQYYLHREVFELFKIPAFAPQLQRYGFAIWARVPPDMYGVDFASPGVVSRTIKSLVRKPIQEAMKCAQLLMDYDNLVVQARVSDGVREHAIKRRLERLRQDWRVQKYG